MLPNALSGARPHLSEASAQALNKTSATKCIFKKEVY
jgi:hypothetical protein